MKSNTTNEPKPSADVLIGGRYDAEHIDEEPDGAVGDVDGEDLAVSATATPRRVHPATSAWSTLMPVASTQQSKGTASRNAASTRTAPPLAASMPDARIRRRLPWSGRRSCGRCDDPAVRQLDTEHGTTSTTAHSSVGGSHDQMAGHGDGDDPARWHWTGTLVIDVVTPMNQR
nr:unnamed protein product [Digitaria exilis]